MAERARAGRRPVAKSTGPSGRDSTRRVARSRESDEGGVEPAPTFFETLGNQAIGRLVDARPAGGAGATTATIQRKPSASPSVTKGPSTPLDTADLLAKKLSEAMLAAGQQVDWGARATSVPKSTPTSGGIVISSTGPKDVESFLIWAKRAPGAEAALGTFVVSDLIDRDRKALEAYSKAVQGGKGTPHIEKPVATAADAELYGQNLPGIIDAFGALAASVVRQPSERAPHVDQVKDLTPAMTKDIKAYRSGFSPRFEATNGADVNSYLQLRDEAFDPAVGAASLKPYMHNPHRFEAAGLRQLDLNMKQVPGLAAEPAATRRKLTLVLHSGQDHNGAFHRDQKMTEVFTVNNGSAGKPLAVLVEDADSLTSAQKRIEGIVGKDVVIAGALIAGHGDATSTEVGGPGASLDLKTNRKATLAFLKFLIQHMDKSPDAQIAFNACLVGSHDIDPKTMNQSGAAAGSQAAKVIAKNPNLVDVVNELAKKEGVKLQVLGANGSVSALDLVDPATGKLKLDPSKPYTDAKGVKQSGASLQDDPILAPKAEYLEKGKEAEGVVRAYVEVSLASKVDADKIVAKRVNEKSVDGVVIDVFLGQAVKGDSKHAAVLSASMRNVTLAGEDDVSGSTLAATLPPKDRVALLIRLAKEIGGMEGLKFAVAGVLTGQQAAVFIGDVIERLEGDPSLTVNRAGRFIEAARIGPATETGLKSFAWDQGHLRLALADVLARGKSAAPSAVKGLKADVDTTTTPGTAVFGRPADVEAALGGASSPGDVVTTLGFKQGAVATKSGGTALQANVDLDGDGVNETFVQFSPFAGTVKGKGVGLRETPSWGAKPASTLKSGTAVSVLGTTLDGWLAVSIPGPKSSMTFAWPGSIAPS